MREQSRTVVIVRPDEDHAGLTWWKIYDLDSRLHFCFNWVPNATHEAHPGSALVVAVTIGNIGDDHVLDTQDGDPAYQFIMSFRSATGIHTEDFFTPAVQQGQHGIILPDYVKPWLDACAMETLCQDRERAFNGGQYTPAYRAAYQSITGRTPDAE